VVGCTGDPNPQTFSHIIISNNVVHDAPGGGISTCYADYITIEQNTTYLNAFWSPYGNSGISI
jgi:parallel beta-helix repeat protein